MKKKIQQQKLRMEDTGHSRLSQSGTANIIFCPFIPKKYMKMKTLVQKRSTCSLIN